MVVTSGSNEFELNDLQIQTDGGEAMLADDDMASDRADENANSAQAVADFSKSASNDSPSTAKARMALSPSPTSRIPQSGQKHGSAKNPRNSMSSNGDSETDLTHFSTTQARKRKCDVLMTVVAPSSMNTRFATPITVEHVASATRHSMMSDDSESSLSSTFSSPSSDCGNDLVCTDDYERAAKKRKMALQDHPAALLHPNSMFDIHQHHRAKSGTSKLKRSLVANHVGIPTTSCYASATFNESRAKTALLTQVNSCMSMEDTRSAADAIFENCPLQQMVQVVDEKMTSARAENSSLSMQNLIDAIEKCLARPLNEVSRERIRQVASIWLEQHPEQADM